MVHVGIGYDVHAPTFDTELFCGTLKSIYAHTICHLPNAFLTRGAQNL
jgi:hypothetical protein